MTYETAKRLYDHFISKGMTKEAKDIAERNNKKSGNRPKLDIPGEKKVEKPLKEKKDGKKSKR